MKAAPDILRAAYSAGLDVSVAASGNLYVEPLDRLTPALREQLLAHKPELLAFLREAERLTGELLERAMAACDHHGDSEQARADMRTDCRATPPHLRGNLLDHFRRTYGRTA